MQPSSLMHRSVAAGDSCNLALSDELNKAFRVYVAQSIVLILSGSDRARTTALSILSDLVPHKGARNVDTANMIREVTKALSSEDVNVSEQCKDIKTERQRDRLNVDLGYPCDSKAATFLRW